MEFCLPTIDTKIRNIVRKLNPEYLDEALVIARNLARENSDSALALNTLGKVLIWCLAKNSSSVHLQESLTVYARAVSLVPNCMLTRLMYCQNLFLSEDYEKAGVELKVIDTILEPEDPILNAQILPGHIANGKTMVDRLDAVFEECKSLESIIHKRILEDLARKEGLEKIERAEHLVEIFPSQFSYHHVCLLSMIRDAHDMGTTNCRRFMKNALSIARRATKGFPASLVAALYLARIFFLLDDYNGAQEECRRALRIEDPRDPDMDNISYIEENIEFKGAIQAEGDTKGARVAWIKKHFTFLLDAICLGLTRHWKSLDPSDKGCVLTLVVDDLTKYGNDTRFSTIASILKEAVSFFEEKNQWDYWNCPGCGSGQLMSLKTHICKQNFPKELRNKLKWKDNAASEITLWKDREGKKVLTLEYTAATFEYPTLLWSEGVASFTDVKKKKSQDRSSKLAAFKKKMKGVQCDEELKLMWHELLDSCHLSYSEYLMPFIRSYMWTKLAKHWSTQIAEKEIKPEKVNSVFWAGDSNFDQESGKDRQDDVLKVGYTTQDQMFLKSWQKKRDTSYKWFSDISFPKFEEYKETWLSHDAHANDNSLSHSLQDWELAIDSPQKELKVQNDRRLIITNAVPGSKRGLYYAWMAGSQLTSTMVPCVVTHKKSMQEVTYMFGLLTACNHPNILKPLGVWKCKEELNSGYIIFPSLDGAINQIPRTELFVEDGNIICEFTHKGHKLMRDIISGVQCINAHYPCCEPSAPCPLKLSPKSIFYVQDVTQEYHAYIGDFNVKSDKLELDQVVISNWNSIGQCLGNLCGMTLVDDELHHLMKALRDPLANYADLSWEPGAWTVSEKMLFVREVHWIQNFFPARKSELEKIKPSPLGIKPFANQVSSDWKEGSLQSDVNFLRNKVVGHQDSVYRNYKGDKEDIGITKSTIEKLLRREAPRCMLILVREIRKLEWPILSPFCRRTSDTKRWTEDTFAEPTHPQQQYD